MVLRSVRSLLSVLVRRTVAHLKRTHDQQHLHHNPTIFPARRAAFPLLPPTSPQASFVLAGGMLPHVLEPLVPAVRQFVLSYHPPGGRPPVTMDPWDPPVLSSLEVQGCQGVLVVELYSPFKVSGSLRGLIAFTLAVLPRFASLP